MTHTLPQLLSAPFPSRASAEPCCDANGVTAMSMDEAARATADLEILAHPVRMQLLDLLARRDGSVCVCDLEAAVPVKQPTVSHHLKLLRQAGLVDSERQGLYAYYRVDRVALRALTARISERLAAFE